MKKRTIKVGFTNDGLKTIVEEPTDEMLEMYYKKQGREKTSSSMSTSKKSFKAIDLRDWYEYSWQRNKDLVHKVQTGQYDLIFETKLDFDPPLSNTAIDSLKASIAELEWRLSK